MRVKISWVCCVFIAFYFGSISSSALAIAPIVSLPKPEEVRNATIGLYGQNIDTYEPVTESKIFQSGCVYVTKPKSDSNIELLKILQDGVTLSDMGAHRFRLRTVIYLHLADNSVFRLLISDGRNRTPGVFGTVDNDLHDSQGFLSSDEAMLKILRAWVKKNLKAEKSSSNC